MILISYPLRGGCSVSTALKHIHEDMVQRIVKQVRFLLQVKVGLSTITQYCFCWTLSQGVQGIMNLILAVVVDSAAESREKGKADQEAEHQREVQNAKIHTQYDQPTLGQ